MGILKKFNYVLKLVQRFLLYLLAIRTKNI